MCLSNSDEIAISPEASVSAFHAIFVSMSSTSAAKVGDSVTLDILVSNFLLEGEGCMAVSVHFNSCLLRCSMIVQHCLCQSGVTQLCFTLPLMLNIPQEL